MTLYLIGAGFLILLFLGWKYGRLVLNSFKLKLSEREAFNHAEINRKNKEIDKELTDEKDKIGRINPDNLLESLKRMRDDRNESSE